jgi:uncharacterized membrane protein
MSYVPPGWTPQGPVLWAYKTVLIGGPPNAIEAQLMQIGADGWELVSTWLVGNQPNPATSSGNALAIFKRPYVGPR